ncbi:hypothetical protein TSMEX_000765 [Taenia solium]|eukprot:TsM_000611400 transcript=TsM_000611400 gene=TsM_000611400
MPSSATNTTSKPSESRRRDDPHYYTPSSCSRRQQPPTSNSVEAAEDWRKLSLQLLQTRRSCSLAKRKHLAFAATPLTSGWCCLVCIAAMAVNGDCAMGNVNAESIHRLSSTLPPILTTTTTYVGPLKFLFKTIPPPRFDRHAFPSSSIRFAPISILSPPLHATMHPAS